MAWKLPEVVSNIIEGSTRATKTFFEQFASQEGEEVETVAASAQAAAEAASLPVATKVVTAASTASSKGRVLASTGTSNAAEWRAAALLNAAVLDLYYDFGCRPEEDITAKVIEAIEQATTAGANAMILNLPVDGTYLLNGAQKTGEALGYTYSGQVLLPAYTESEGPVYISIRGASPAIRAYYKLLEEPTVKRSGVIIKSNATTGALIDVIPGIEIAAGTVFSNIHFDPRDITFEAPNNPQCNGLKMVAAARFSYSGIGIETETTKEGEDTFPTGTGRALWLPGTNNDGFVRGTNSYAAGFPVGLQHSEHTILDGMQIHLCAVAIDVYADSAHHSHYVYVNVERCPTVLRARNEGEGGGYITGLLDVENFEAGEFKFKNMIEDSGNRLRGRLTIRNESGNGKGWPQVEGRTIALSDPHYGDVNSKDVYPEDNFTRVNDIAGNLGVTAQTKHVWHLEEGSGTTVTSSETVGAMRASTVPMAATLSYPARYSNGSRTVYATVNLRKTGTYNDSVVIEKVIGGANAGNFLAIKLNNELISIAKVIAGTPTTLKSSGKVIKNEQSCVLAIAVTHPNFFGAPTKIEVWLGEVLVVEYELSATDKSALTESAGQLNKQDGIKFAEDTESTLVYFRVAPGINLGPAEAPTASGTENTVVVGAASGDGKSQNAAITGNAVATAFKVPHTLNTKMLSVSILNATFEEPVTMLAKAVAISATEVEVTFTVAPGAKVANYVLLRA